MRHLYTFLLLSLLCGQTWAQDPHFSQFYISPLTLSPALTGMINGQARAAATYRSQWASVSVPYETMALAADASLLEGRLRNDRLGIGLLLLRDQAGTSALSQTQINLSMAYSKSFGRNGRHFLSAGAQYGAVQQRIDVSNIRFDSQFNGQGFDPGTASGEIIETPQRWYGDLAAGLSWTSTFDRYSNAYGGIAMHHLNTPNVSFLGDARERLPMRLTLYAGGEFRLNGYLSLQPRGVLLRQGSYTEVNLGGLLRYFLHDVDSDQLISVSVGGYHRIGDAQSVIARLDYGPLSVGLAYDINISALERASQNRGGFELVGVYQMGGDYEKGRVSGGISCPRF